MTPLYLRVWHGEDDNWITLTPQNPDTTDSANFDEGTVAGFAISIKQTDAFLSDLQQLLRKYGTEVR